MIRAFTAAMSFALVIASSAFAHDHAGHARHHEGFYMGLKQPGTGVSCCNNMDCRPAQYRMTAIGVEFFVHGRWIMPPASKLIEHDRVESGHWCGTAEATASPITFCAVVPRGGV